MKKIIAIILVTFLSLALVTACGSNMYDRGRDDLVFATSAVAPSAPMEAPQAVMSWDTAGSGFSRDYSYEIMEESDISRNDELETLTPEVPVLPDAPNPNDPTAPEIGAGSGFAEKIIYTASVDIETLDFDQTIENIYLMMNNYGAFIESSNISGRNHWQIQNNQLSYRSAWFTIRVPQEHLKAMTAGMNTLGNVLSVSNFAENITAQFVDTEARLSALRIQEERLLVMLSRAEDITDMIVIEQSLAEVRYQIESITSTLRNWENRVRFSTLNLYIQEVHEFTELEEQPYWQQVWTDLLNTLKDTGIFFANLLKWFIVNLPILIILAVIAVVVTIITRRAIRKHRKNQKENSVKKLQKAQTMNPNLNPYYNPNYYTNYNPNYNQNINSNVTTDANSNTNMEATPIATPEAEQKPEN